MISTPHDNVYTGGRNSSASLSPIQIDDPPTLRVSIVAPSEPVSCSVQTPPPFGERRLSASISTGAMRQEPKTLGAPLKVGDRIMGFELVEELGQGAFARVFLARQETLARRLVALKVTLRPTREPDKLARLQHTHIVPIYSVHDAEPVQIICMPFLGRKTIADFIRVFRADGQSRGVLRKTSGTRAAKTTTVPESRTHPKSTPSSGKFAAIPPVTLGETTPDLIGDPIAVLKLIGQLASGLAHAHSRGILHLDLKPANVLLADTGEPMLLDFNLSFDVTQPERELIGGTVPYMSVEQLRDLRTRGKGQVDARADLYSLGVMAYEMLTGSVPFQATFLADIDALVAARKKGPPSIRALNPLVSPAVEAIVRKLLEAEPGDRYQTAEALQTDIDRHLSHRPLQFAREPSLRERFGKWRRRNPGVPGRMLAASLLGLALGLGGVAYSRADAFAKTNAVMRVAGLHAKVPRMRLDLILPGDSVARKRGMAEATAMLESYGLPVDPHWKLRKDVQRLTGRDRAALEGTLGEVLLLLAQARWLEAEGRPDEIRLDAARSALGLNVAARDCFPSDAVPDLLEQQAAEWNQSLGEPLAAAPRKENHEPNARALFLNASANVSRGYYFTAIESLEKAIELEPGHAAAHYCLAFCRQQLGQYDRAIERYDAARVLMPLDPRPYFQRGTMFSMRFQFDLAETQFSKAIELDEHFTLAYRNRGVLRLRKGLLSDAESDLTTALVLGGSPIQLYMLRAEARSRLKDASGAEADRKVSRELKPVKEGDFLVRGVMNIDSDPRSALADFESAARINPRSIPALQNQVHVLSDKLNDLPEALKRANQAVKLFPEYAPVRASRAIILARQGDRDEAIREVEKMRKLSQDSDMFFRAACVYSLTSRTHPEDAREAIHLLWEAIRKGYQNTSQVSTDKDLDPIRSLKEFKAIEQAFK